MKKKLVAFAVTAAMIVTSAVPALAWAPAGSQDWPTTNEVVMDSTHLKAGIENVMGDPITNGDADSITVDFNRLEGEFSYNIRLVTNKGNEKVYSAKLTNGKVAIDDEGAIGVSGITTLTWRFDTTDANKQFLELVVDEMNNNKEPETIVVDLPVEYESIVKTVVKATGKDSVPAGSMLVMYQNQVPTRVVDVQVIKSTLSGDPILDKYGKLQFVEQPVLGETYAIYSITLDDETVIYNYNLAKDGSYVWNGGVVARYVDFKWEVTDNKGNVTKTVEKNEFKVTDDYKGKYVTLTISGNKDSGIFGTAVWGQDADALAVQKRIAGENRYETAMAVADQMKDANGFETIFVADGTKYADALSATALAKKMDAPILLVNGKTGDYEDEVAAYIEKNATNYDTTVYVVGGEKAVSKDFADKVYKMRYDVERLAGENRYATNVEILKKYADYAGFSKVLVASATSFPDALSASATGLPILLVGDEIKPVQDKYLKEIQDGLYGGKVGEFVIVGGTTAVSKNVQRDLASKDYLDDVKKVSRIGGENRFETNQLVVNKLMNKGKGATYVFVATANNFADALTGGVFAAKTGSPLVLVNENNTAVAKKIVKVADPTMGFVVLGGENAVSNETVQKIA